MFDSLYARLAVGLAVLVIGLTALFGWIAVRSGQVFFEELTQRVNRELASSLIADTGLAVSGGAYDEAALESVFHTYMVIHPSIEVYLLGPDGGVLAFSAPPGKVSAERVDLQPVRAFLADDPALPIRGDNPRRPGERAVFSAAPIGTPDDVQGYLYVVLTGDTLNSVAGMVSASNIPRLAAVILLAGGAIAFLVGLGLLRLLTRRLRELTARIEQFESQPLAPEPDRPATTDDLGRLQSAFERMAARIAEQLAALRRTDDLRRELVANVSHDLRTPLTAIHGFLETLVAREHALDPDERREFLRLALRQTERLGRQVEALFELATLEPGHATPASEPCRLPELVQDVVLKHRLRAQAANVHLACRAADEGDRPVAVDVSLLERALDNLIDNALKHTPAGGHIVVEVGRDDTNARITVTDTGVGIAAEELPYVFDRYYQVRRESMRRESPSSTRTASNGTPTAGAGLGLAITRRIVALHGGTIEIDSTPGCGTHVRITLPLEGPDVVTEPEGRTPDGLVTLS